MATAKTAPASSRPNPYGKKIEDQELSWTAPKLVLLGIVTLGCAFTFLYLISP